jgi:hypothetical protein
VSPPAPASVGQCPRAQTESHRVLSESTCSGDGLAERQGFQIMEVCARVLGHRVPALSHAGGGEYFRTLEKSPCLSVARVQSPAAPLVRSCGLDSFTLAAPAWPRAAKTSRRRDPQSRYWLGRPHAAGGGPQGPTHATRAAFSPSAHSVRQPVRSLFCRCSAACVCPQGSLRAVKTASKVASVRCRHPRTHSPHEGCRTPARTQTAAIPHPVRPAVRPPQSRPRPQI